MAYKSKFFQSGYHLDPSKYENPKSPWAVQSGNNAQQTMPQTTTLVEQATKPNYSKIEMPSIYNNTARKIDRVSNRAGVVRNELTSRLAEETASGQPILDPVRDKLKGLERQQAALEAQREAEIGPQKQSVGKTVFDVVDRGAGYFNQGVANTADFVANLLPRAEGALLGVDPEATFTGQVLKPVTTATGKFKDYVDSEVAGIDARVQNDTKDSKAAQVAANLGSQAVSILPNTILAIASGGASVPGQLTAQGTGVAATTTAAIQKMASNPMYWTSAAQSLGNNYEEAKANGATDEEAIAAALLSTAFNSAVEVGGGLETLPDELIGVDLSNGQKALKWLKSTLLEEPGEEIVQDVITRLTNAGVYDKDAPVFSMEDENAIINPKRMGKTYLESAAVSGILGGGQAIASDVINRAAAGKPTQNQVDTAIQETLGQKETAPVAEQEAKPVVDVETAFNQAVNEAKAKATVTPDMQQTVEDANDLVNSVRQKYHAYAMEHGQSMDNYRAFLGTLTEAEREAFEAWSGSDIGAVNDTETRDTDAKPAMGAADYGFDPISNASNKYGAIPPGEKAARVVDLPVSMDGKTKVSQFARTGAESAVAGEEGAQRILDLVAENKLSHEVFTDDAALEAAGKEIADAYRNGNVYNVYTRFLQDVAEGKVGKDLMATGSILFADASTAKDHESAAELFIALTELQRRGGQAVQAARLLKKLSPEGRVWVMRKTVEKINRGISAEGKKGAGLNKVSTKTKNEVAQVVREERDKALRQLAGKETPSSKEKTNAKTKGQKSVGDKLAEIIDKNKNPGPAKERTAEQKVLKDLEAFAKAYMDEKKPQFEYSSAKALEHFLLHQEEYEDAWDEARWKLQEKYADNPEMLDALNDFVVNSIGMEQIEKGIDKDISKALRVFGIKTSDLVKMSTEERADTANRVVRNLMMDNKLPAAEAAKMKNFIIERFENKIEAEKERIAQRAANKERDHGLAVEDWTQEIGNEVARALGEKPAEAKPKPISRTIKQDILRFVDKKYQPQRATQKRKMLDTLTDYFANRAEYDRAWNAAKETYGATYDSNPDGFAGADAMLGGTGSDAVVGRVIVEEIVEQDLKQKNIDARMFLGDQANLEDQIANAIIQKTGATGDDQTFIRQSVNWYLENKFDPKKTTGSIDHAIKETLSSKAINDAKIKISDIIRYSPSDKAAIANKVAAMLVQDYGVSKEGAQTAAANIVKRFNDMIAESAEKRLASMFKERSYEQKTVQQRFRELANMGAFSGSDYADQVTEKLFGSAVHIDNDLLNEYMNATDPDAIREVEDKIYKSIGEQIPSNFKDKWNAWRYMSMLGTFKGPERNFIGNTAGAVMRVSKNLPAAIGEAWLERRGKIGKDERTKTIVPAGRELKQAAKDDLKNVKNELKGVGKYHVVNDKIQESRQIFNFKPLEGARKGVDLLMADTWFSNDAYVSSLANFLKARGYTAEDFKGNGMTEAQKAEARDYAVSEALKATYRDLNWLSDTITSMRFNPKTAKTPGGAKAKEVGNALLDGVQPFLKTPANILARGIEHDTVLGTISTIVKASEAKKRGEYKATEMLDDLSKTLTGTLIATLGYFMREHGLIVARSDDEEQDDLEGRSEYSLVIGGKYIPIDWMAPFVMSLFVGAELHDLLESASDNGAPLTSKIGNSLNSLTSALFQTSMLEGLQSTIDNVKYADSAPIALVANATLGYLGQAAPTVFGQFERMLNPYQEMTFVDKSNKWLDADWQRALGSLSRKVPGWDYNQIPYIDAWGRKIETGGTGKRVFDSLFNPANTSEVRETEVDVELERLEQETGNGDLTPSRAQSVLTIDGEQVILTADEYLTYAQSKGQNDFTFRESVMASEAYAALDSNTQWRVHKLSEELANDLAINEIGIKKENMTDWHKDLIGADIETITQTLIERAVLNEAKDIGDGSLYNGLPQMLDNGTVDDAIALSLLSKEVQDKYAEYGTGLSVSTLCQVISYKNSEEAKSEYESKFKDGKRQEVVVEGKSNQDKTKKFIESLGESKSTMRKIWCCIYAESTCPW